MGMRRSLVVAVALFIFAAGLWMGWAANSFLAQDACLDRGGAWNREHRTCETAPD